MLVILTYGVDFILQAAFMLADLKSTKRHWWLDCLFALYGSALVKAEGKHVGEINPCCQFHQRFMLSFYTCRSQKREKYSYVITIILRFRDLRSEKLRVNMLVKSTPGGHFSTQFQQNSRKNVNKFWTQEIKTKWV